MEPTTYLGQRQQGTAGRVRSRLLGREGLWRDQETQTTEPPV